MIPHAYATDAQHKSQDLAAAVASASAPPAVAAACSAIDSFLRHHSPDQCRWFFSVTFPTLICRLFGFDHSSSSSPTSSPPANPSSSTGWLDLVSASKDSDLAGRVFDLLSPSGILLSSISSVDRLSLVKYVFPSERLPEWVRVLLSSERDCGLLPELCPLFKGRIKGDPVKGNSFQVQLNVFEYYMFWFAYYPVCRWNPDGSIAGPTSRSRKSRLENWASTFPVLAGTRRGGPEQKMECSLYVRLLYSYLRSYVPVHDLSSHQPYRSSLLHYPSGYDGLAVLQAEFLVNTLVHFWLTYNDFSPFPMNVCKSFGVSFPSRMVLSETPPTPGLGRIVELFVKYLNINWISSTESVGYACTGSSRWRISRSPDVLKSKDTPLASSYALSWSTCIPRPLYRFILRTFLFYPVGSSMKNASEVLSLWISYMEPWAISLDDFNDLDAVVDRPANLSKRDQLKPSCGYSSLWQGYVLSNYLFYSSMVMHFIGFAHKFLHTDPELIVQMVLKIINVLTSSSELIELEKSVDTIFHSKQAESGKMALNSLQRYVPSIREQLQDWEHGLTESDADGSFLHENWNKDLRLFSYGENGGRQLLQLFILRAESELQAVSGRNLTDNLRCIDSLKTQLGCLYGGLEVKTPAFAADAGRHLHSRDEIFKPRRVGNYALDDIKYKGDWMKRPISDDEIAWLAKLLVGLSAWLNENLGLNRVESIDVGLSWPYLEVSDVDVGEIHGPTDSFNMLLSSIGSGLIMLGAAAVRLMRKRGLRVNLRVLASKKIVMMVLVVSAAALLRRAFRQFQRA